MTHSRVELTGALHTPPGAEWSARYQLAADGSVQVAGIAPAHGVALLAMAATSPAEVVAAASAVIDALERLRDMARDDLRRRALEAVA